MTSLSNKFLKENCPLKFFFVISILFLPLWIISHDYIIDWDVLRYAIDVRIHNQGDPSFSYAHNLIRTILYNIAVVIEKFTGTLDSLYAAKILTFISSSFTSFCIYFSVKKISCRTCFFLLVFNSC